MSSGIYTGCPTHMHTDLELLSTIIHGELSRYRCCKCRDGSDSGRLVALMSMQHNNMYDLVKYDSLEHAPDGVCAGQDDDHMYFSEQKSRCNAKPHATGDGRGILSRQQVDSQRRVHTQSLCRLVINHSVTAKADMVIEVTHSIQFNSKRVSSP